MEVTSQEPFQWCGKDECSRRWAPREKCRHRTELKSELLAGEKTTLSPVCLATSLMGSLSKSLAFTLSLQLLNRIKPKVPWQSSYHPSFYAILNTFLFQSNNVDPRCLMNCVTISKSLNLSETQFPHLYNNDNYCIQGVVRELSTSVQLIVNK